MSAPVTPASAPPSVGDVLNQFDIVIKFTEQAVAHDVLDYSDELMRGYLMGLTSFRRYLRSADFPQIVRATKETPTHAPRA